MPKIVNERYQLVKLCHIDCSGPVFLRRTVYSPRSLLFTQFKRITVTGRRTERQTYRQTDGSAISIAERLRRKHLFFRDLLCVKWDVKLCLLTDPLSLCGRIRP